MDTGTDLFRLAQARLEWLDRRQTLLAENIANADTPGYSPRDLLPFNQALAQVRLVPVRTSPLHLAGAARAEEEDPMLRPPERAPDGNAVSLQEEMMKVAQTDSAHQLVTGLYEAWAGMVRTALDKG